jgi:hypothetical protein
MDLYMLGAFHGITVLITALFIIYSDHQGYLYFRGKKQTLSPTFITWSHRIVWIGLAIIILTGAALAIPTWEYRLTQGVFYVKMGFVLVLLMNAVAIGKLSHKASNTPFAALSPTEKKTLTVSGALSFLGWVSAAFIGYFLL